MRSLLRLGCRQYSLDYVDQERGAQIAELGIWRGKFVPPWDWRRGVRIEQAAGRGFKGAYAFTLVDDFTSYKSRFSRQVFQDYSSEFSSTEFTLEEITVVQHRESGERGNGKLKFAYNY